MVCGNGAVPSGLVVDLAEDGCYDCAMHGNHLIYQYVKASRRWLFAAGLAVLPLVATFGAQLPKPNLPDPIKFIGKRDNIIRATHAVLEQLGYTIELEDMAGGKIVTRPYEFVSGTITSSEIDKIAVKNDTVTGAWLRAHYVVEVLFEAVSSTETLVTVRTRMEALNRDVNGTEKWEPIQSLGSVERRVLGKISMKLLGTEPEFKDNKSFWEKKPQPVPPIKKITAE